MSNEDLLAHEFPPEVLRRYRDADGVLEATPKEIRTTEALCQAQRFDPGKGNTKHWDGPPKSRELPF